MMDNYVGQFDVWDQLWKVLAKSRGRWVAYIYRVDSKGRAIRPYVAKYYAAEDLPMTLRDELNGGHFEVLIRDGRTIRFSGRIAVVEGWRPA